MTLIELMVSMAILSAALVIFLGTLASIQVAVDRQGNRSINNDQARLAAEQLDHEVRSGNLLYDPALENDPANGIYPGMSLRIYTQVNANVREPGNQCVQWRILNSQLQERRWGIDWRNDPTTVTHWTVVAHGIVNQQVSPPTPAFAQDPTKGGRTIIISFLVSANPDAGTNVLIKESVTGRNTEYGYPSNVCADIPPY
jgi:type II secretory pathway pseudopilin PulG